MPRKQLIRADFLTRFQPQADVPMAKQPITVRLPEDIDTIVRSLPNRTEWLREAILDRLEQDELLPDRYFDE
jgi:hypothetical protein